MNVNTMTNEELKELFWTRAHDTPDRVFAVCSRIHIHIIDIFVWLHLAKVGPRMMMSIPFVPDKIYGWLTVIDGPKIILWLIDKLGDLSMKLDPEAQERLTTYNNYINNVYDYKHKNDEA